MAMKKTQYTRLLLCIAASLLGSTDAYLRIRNRGTATTTTTTKTSQANRQLLVRYLKSKADLINPAFFKHLSNGVSYDAKIQEKVADDRYGACSVSGSASYSINKITSLPGVTNSQHGTSIIEPVEGEDGLWTLQTTFDSFEAEMTAVVLGKSCGRVMDFSSFGFVKVDGATVKATIRLNGPTNQPQVIDIVEVKQQNIEFKSSTSFSQLVKKIPLKTVEKSMNDFLHSIFTSKFQSVMEGELKRSSPTVQ